MKRVLTEELMIESTQRYCAFYKASDGKWYMDLAPSEYGEYEDATTYGPFHSQEKALEYLDNFSNPGGYNFDDSGTAAPPTLSPNGDPVRKPSESSRVGMGGFRRYRF